MLFVRKEGDETARSVDDARDAQLHAESFVSRHADGPFGKLAVVIERDARLRDDLAERHAIPALATYRRDRLVALGLGLPPALVLLELDRELVSAGAATVGRGLVDVLLAVFIVVELTRKTPRAPRAAAVALFAIALRWVLMMTRTCGRDVAPLIYGAVIFSALAGAVVLTRAPTRARVALELLDRLGITPAEARAARATPEPSQASLGGAILAAAGLPALFFALRHHAVPLVPQMAVVAIYGALAPEIVRRVTKDEAKAAASALRGRAEWLRIARGIAIGLATAAALATAAKLFTEAGTEVARCVGRLDKEAARLADAQATELARAVARLRSSTPLVLATVVVFPFVEERLFRGLLQDVLVRKYGAAYGMFVASLAFGFAHVGVYEAALYQTALLGFGFGIAYVEGGLVAAIVAHAIWNAILLLG